MALSAKKKFAFGFVMLLITVMVGVSFLAYNILAEVEIVFEQSPNSVEAHEANRKLKLLNEAQSGKRKGFIRLSEAEINSFLQSRYRNLANKVQTNSPAQLVKVGVVLHHTDLTFVTWHNVKLLGLDLPVIWQRTLKPDNSPTGWTLALSDMRVGSLQVPERFWSDVAGILGAGDSTFEERKVWLASIPTVMLSRNEITRSPELRLYSYIPAMKQEIDPFESEQLNASAGGTNTLSANVNL